MSAIPFSRDKITYRSGVQLLSLVDNTERGILSNTDQIFASIGRFTRGAIDRAFLIDPTTRKRAIGAPSSVLANPLNESHIQIYEALDAGAFQACISRLVPAAAVNSYMVATDVALDPLWSVAAALPADYLIAVKHLECFNDGVRIGLHAVEALDGVGAQVATSTVKVRLIDIATGDVLFDDFEGSLLVDSKNEFGVSDYLPSVVSSLTEMVEISVDKTSVPITADYYGMDVDGAEKWTFADLIYFAEGGTVYDNADYDAAIQRLYDTDIGYGYLHAGGTQNVALLSKLVSFAYKVNKPFPFDVPGDLSVEAAIAFMANLNVDSHYPVAYWAPLQADDPLNGGKALIGTSGIQIGLRCNRNAQTDANDVAPKQYPVAGKNYPVSRTGMRQLRKLSDPQLEALGKARINPVVYEIYASGGRYVFRDSLTCAKTTGDKKLSSVAEMSASVDDAVTAYSKETLQLPMGEAIKRTTQFIEKTFEALQTAGWFVPSAEMKGAAYSATITPNSRFPKEKMDVRYSISYEGVARIITVQQTLSK